MYWLLVAFGAPFVVYVLLRFLAYELPHHILMWLDRRHRQQCEQHRRALPFASVPHVKTIVRKSTTGLHHWRLHCHEGRQRWFFEPDSIRPQTFFEQYQLGLVSETPASPIHRTVEMALDQGATFLKRLQDPVTGHWPNDYSGPLFLLPGAVFAKYIMFQGDQSKMWPAAHRSEMLRYIANTQNPTDGGWGLHTEDHSTMFGTVLNYVAARLLGEPHDSRLCERARLWITQRGGATSVPSWGKGWLSILGVYEWQGMNPVPPEMWLLPDWLPISMGRVWCHSRIVTLPFGYFYGKKFHGPITPLIEEIRREIYLQPYSSIHWPSQRSNVFEEDVYTPHSGFYRFANWFLTQYEKFPIKALRRRAIAKSLVHMKYDDMLTHYICLGPVNKSLHMIASYLEEGLESDAVRMHIDRLDDYFWIGPEGMRMSGYNGSQLWDTSFAAQALVATHDGAQKHQLALNGAYRYIDVAQVREDPPRMREFYHSPTKGCWNFSTRDQGWQVSDCTAEGLRVALLLRHHPEIVPDEQRIADERICDAVDVILALRNATGDGGWASYEESRAPTYMELLNCAEVYKDIMIDYTYPECTSSCVHSLVLFRRQFPEYRTDAVNRAIMDGVRVIKQLQRPDGSWYGSWGCCFTYAAWLTTDALTLAGEKPGQSPTLQKACEFLLSKQRRDGGWGEDINSCVTGEWVENPDGAQVVNTAWACMALMAAGGTAHFAQVSRGIQLILARQLPSGDWAQERISGVFNGNCAIHYPAYKNNMPVWALAKYKAMKGIVKQML